MKSSHISTATVEVFERVQSQLMALADELGTLSKKSPDAPLNRFKVSIVNERLRLANTLLKGEHLPFENFSQFDVDQLPTASDVVVVISQYLNSLEGWRSANVVQVAYNWFWNTKDHTYRSSAPSRFRHGDDE